MAVSTHVMTKAENIRLAITGRGWRYCTDGVYMGNNGEELKLNGS